MSEPTIQDQLDCLYRTWKRPEPSENFIAGGLIDEATYLGAPVRVAWVLKEAVDKGRDDWPLPAYFRDVANGGRGPSRTARPLGVFTWALVHGVSSYEGSREKMKDGLRLLGITNLKKSGGGSSSDWPEIDRHAERDQGLWMEELRIMSPDIVICGGTFWNVQKRIGLQGVRAADGGAHYGWCKMDGRSILVVDAWHPAHFKPGREKALGRLLATVVAGRASAAERME